MSGRHRPVAGADSYDVIDGYLDTLDGPGAQLSTTEAPHWACPDCGEPCRCTDEALRRAPHVRCGIYAP